MVEDEENPKVRNALQEAGLTYLFAKNPDKAVALMQEKPVDIFLARIHDQTEDFSLFDQANKYSPNAEQIAIFDTKLERFYPQLISRAYPRSLIADNKPLNIPELLATIRKLVTKEIFGLAPYGLNSEPPIILKSSQEKYQAMDTIIDFFRTHDVPKRILENISLILQELINNAIYDAPVNKEGERKYCSHQESQEVALEEHERPKIEYGLNSETLGVSVADNFGNLRQETFFKFVNRCFSEKKIVEADGKGAGMGLFLIFKSLDRLVINVEYHRRSEVIALIDYHSKIRELKKRHHSFHYFHIDGS